MRVGLEHELLTADARTGGVVAIDRLRDVVSTGSTDGRPSYAGCMSFEPGGQLELSLPAEASASLLADRFASVLAEVEAECTASDIELIAEPVDQRRADEVPLQLHSPRYLAMQAHFDRIGSAGRRMMRRTASTQVCLDWWPGRAGVEQWRLLNLAAPFLAAAVARDRGPGSRLATWLEVDPGRTAFDGRLVAGDDPVAAYADLARGATWFTEPGDLAQHLTTLFPPVRPRGRYLEVRFPDVQEDDAVAPLAAAFARLVHDDDARRDALAALEREAPHLERHWHDAAHGLGEVEARGRDLLAGLLAGSGAELVGAA
jgi:glutamate--cysteine ligase